MLQQEVAQSGILEAQLGRGGPGQVQQQQQSHEDRSRTNLIINYLPQTFDTEDLRALFEKAGPIRTHKVVRDKQTGASLCYGFVDFLFPEHAEKAIGEFHGMRLGNKKLRVAYAATGSSSCAGFVGPDGSPLPLPTMPPRAERHSGGAGSGVGNGGSFIGGGGGLCGSGSGGSALPLRNPGNLYVSGIPRSWTEADLNALFSRFGKLVQIRVLTDPNSGLSKGVGFVTFDDKGNAERAIIETNGLQGPEWPAPLLVKFAEDGSARARSGPRHAGLSASFNLPLDTGRQGGSGACRLSASLCGPSSSAMNGSSGFSSGGFGLSRLLDSDSPTGGGGGGFGFGGTHAGIEEMVDSLLMLNALGTQNAFRTLTGGASNGVGLGSIGTGHRPPGHKEITSDLDVSLSSNGSSLDSPPHDALTALSQLGLLDPELAAAASAGVAPAPAPLHIRTPLIESRPLARALGIKGCRVWIKLENCQPTGSVCLRGMANAVRRAAERGFTHVVTSSSSSGNCGLACAYAAARLGLQCTVVLPDPLACGPGSGSAASGCLAEEVRARIADEGAQVVLAGSAWPEAHARAEVLANQLGHCACLLHPFDSEDVWAGYSGLVDEVAEALNGEQPDAVVLPVSGGGLLSGIVAGLWRYGWVTTPIIAAETRGVDHLAAALAGGGGGGGGGRPCQRALEAAGEQPLHAVASSQEEAARACVSFLGQHQQLTEPVCGAALAAVYNRQFGPQQLLTRPHPANIIVLVTGGRSVGVQQLFELAGGSPQPPSPLPQQQQQQQQQQQA